jgi:hypothetical protein
MLTIAGAEQPESSSIAFEYDNGKISMVILFLKASGSDARDQSIVTSACSGTKSPDAIVERHRGHQRRDSEFIHDSHAEQFQNWHHREEWMQESDKVLFYLSLTREHTF